MSISSSDKWRSEWLDMDKDMIGYFKYLESEGFDITDDTYRYFAADVFHDSPLLSGVADLANGLLTLELENSCCLEHYARSHPSIGISDRERLFRTSISFSGVRDLVAGGASQMMDWEYLTSAVGRDGDHTSLSLLFYAPGGTGTIHVTYGSIIVEDIWPKVFNSFEGTAGRRVVVPVEHDPGVYANDPELLWQMRSWGL